MKRKYTTPTMTIHRIESQGTILVGSVEVEEKEFKVHTDNYETETIDWDIISFD